MLKINTNMHSMNSLFCLQDNWRIKIAELLRVDDTQVPLKFMTIEMIDGYYLCESIPDNTYKKRHYLYISDMVFQYLSGIEVPDVNVGLYLTDYLPSENNQLFLLNPKTQSVLAVQFQLKLLSKDNLPLLDFEFINLLDNKMIPMQEQMNCSWKLLSGSDVYMSDVEKMYQDTFIHKRYVVQVCEKFAKYLEEHGQHDDAKALRWRAIHHDNSKILNKEEFRALTSIINDKASLGDAKSTLSVFKKVSIELHWKNNSHHPEHFASYEEMSRIDRMEMACDWMARSAQYKNDLLSYVETRQQERFHFPESMYKEIFHYCEILVSLCA